MCYFCFERFDNTLAWCVLLSLEIQPFHFLPIEKCLANTKNKVMKINADIAGMLEYAQQHWFKFLLLAIALYLFTQKEFSFSINLSDPEESQELPLNQSSQPQAAQKKQYFTEKVASKRGILDRFDLSPFGGSSKEPSALERLEKISEAQKQEYLKRFAKVAIEERRKFGIPSSVLLGTAYLQSLAGGKDISNSANNHFALRCSNDWRGNTVKKDGECYRVYENAWTSFRDNSLYISSGKYAHLKSLGSTDYKSWASQLEKMGYSPMDNFAQQLVEVVEFYGLQALDKR